jgi:hypothetical protein
MSGWGNQGPVRLMNFKEWVPDKIRFWLYILYLIAFQFSNGFYFTTMAQLVGERDLTMNDTHMLGQTVLIGLTFYFPLAFRLKFYFTNRTSLTIAALGMMLVNIIFPYVHSFPLMMLLSYIGGFCRLYGTFECFSNILPKITPTYNYSVFLSFVFFVVLAFVQVFDWFAIHIIYYYDWQHIYLLAIGLCLMVVLVANVTMSEFRPMPKMPLYGIDWLGIVLWSLFILTAIYIFFYGEQYDWLNGPKIRVAIGFCMILLAICLLRMNHIRHPFIDREAFKCPNLLNMLILFFSLDILLGTQNVLQNTFTSGIMGYDQLVSSQLKWPEFLGGLAAALFTLFARIKLKWHLKILTFISMSAVVVYNILMVGLMSPAIHISQLWLPLFFLGFGHVGVFIALTVYAQANSNFKYYFQVLCILGFIRTGLGDAVSVAIWERALQGTIGTHLATIGSMADLSAPNSFSMIGEEATLSALRGLYGWAVVFGVAVLILILCSHFDRLRNPLPTLKQAYIIVSRAIRRNPKESTYTL